jgi:hypothetical protein
MGSSSNEGGDEDCISDGVGSDADVVVVDLADAGRAALAHKCKCARGEFPWAHTHGLTEGDPLPQKGKKGKHQCSHAKNGFRARPTALVGRPIFPTSTVFPRLVMTRSRSPQVLAFWYKRR